MKMKLLIAALTAIFFLLACKKETPPDLPDCDYLFECKVNGQTWKPIGRWNCSDLQVYYTPDTIGNWIGGRIVVSADQCTEGFIGRSSITFYLDSLYLGYEPKLSFFKYLIVDDKYASVPLHDAMELYDYDSIISSNIVVHEFVPDNYSQDWFGGYINMSFSAILMNGSGETTNITDGRMCQRFQ